MQRILRMLLSLLVVLADMPFHAAVVCRALQKAPQFLVDHYMNDPIEHRRWAVYVDCSHPDRPWMLKPVPWQGKTQTMTPWKKAAAPVAPLVSAGGKVRLWSTFNGATIDLDGTALEAGIRGQTIHVRTGKQGVVLEGRVRGAASVELVRPARWTDGSSGTRQEAWKTQ